MAVDRTRLVQFGAPALALAAGVTALAVVLTSALPGGLPDAELPNVGQDQSAPMSGEGAPLARQFDIITLLPKDAIPAILEPQFLPAAEAAEQMRPEELVLGLSINGDHRAYSLPFLSSHEIVNDTVGGVPVAVTW